ncbi:phosphohydrolase [Niabella ginsenosidivorans]|uniref:Phosphohydrolase n=1 Tax=Niabella ginsenosidivorans TaxID=1176587 RepID=A0A1A9I706_9BACT|nr:Pycsar system effector family protein [Niabella ginsenosidivorans]ANH83467.1 phosphohydrolase [Niabella ginsenosidivorans]
MNEPQLLNHIEQYVQQFMDEHYRPELLYHNKEHTIRVVRAAKQIGEHYRLNEQDFLIVVAAAWFHDLGYYTAGRTDHEKEGARLAADYLQRQHVDTDTITKIQHCILATKMPQNARTLLEQIVCDSDLFHLGTTDFADCNKLMRKEAEAVKGSEISKADWRSKTIQLLQGHQYYTDYCRILLNDQQQQNLDKLLQKEERKKEELPETKQPEQVIEDKKNRNKETSRGVETLFRTTSANNQRLSDMADNKAHILITVNSIILSVILSVLIRKLDNNTHLIYPTILILATSVSTMVISILATRPSIPAGIFTQSDVDTQKVNLLFFGNFYKMHLEDYARGMWKVMGDRDFLYGTLIKDVYSQGVVLGRKYKLLRLAYNIFMFGIVVSVLAFIIAIYTVQ